MSGGATLSAAGLIALRAHAQAERRQQPGRTHLPGAFLAQKRGQGQEVADIRPYISGDDARSIDRNVTARTGTLHVKLHQADRDRTVLLVADFRPSMLWGVKRAFRSVAAAELLAILGWVASEAGARVGTIVITAEGQKVEPPRAGHAAMLSVIGALVEGHAAALKAAQINLADPPLDQSLASVLRIMSRNAEVLLATGLDAAGPNLDRAIEEIEDRGYFRIIEMGDGTAQGLPSGSYRMATASGKVVNAEITVVSKARSVIDPALPPDQALNLLRATA